MSRILKSRKRLISSENVCSHMWRRILEIKQANLFRSHFLFILSLVAHDFPLQLQQSSLPVFLRLTVTRFQHWESDNSFDTTFDTVHTLDFWRSNSSWSFLHSSSSSHFSAFIWISCSFLSCTIFWIISKGIRHRKQFGHCINKRFEMRLRLWAHFELEFVNALILQHDQL